MRRYRRWGPCLMALGLGIFIATALPACFLLLLVGLSLVLLGYFLC